MEDLSEYRSQFISAAQSHVEELQRLLGEIRNDLTNHSVFTQMHISAHSLRGEANAVGYKQFAALVGVAEKYLKHLLDERADFPIEKFPAFAYVVAMIASALHKLTVKKTEPYLEKIIATSREQLGIFDI